MTDIKLKNALGLSIFFGQLSLVLIVLFSPFYGVDFPDAMSLLTVAAPILGAYAVVIVRHFTQHRYQVLGRGRKVSLPFVVVAVTAPAVLYVATVMIFLSYALGWWNVSTENVRFALTSVEGLFGIYLGVIVDALFKQKT